MDLQENYKIRHLEVHCLPDEVLELMKLLAARSGEMGSKSIAMS